MTPEEHAAASAELIAAWLEWDHAAAAMSAVAEAHAAGQRRRRPENRTPPPKPPSYALEPQARRLVAAERALGVPLGWTDRIAALRQPRDGTPGMSAADAVETAVLELTAPPVARVDQLPARGPRAEKEAS